LNIYTLRSLGDEIGVTKDTAANMIRKIKVAKTEHTEILNKIYNYIKENNS